MRSSAWIGSGAALGAGLAALVALGGSEGALAQGIMMMDGGSKTVAARRPAAKPAPRVKRSYYRSPAAGSCGQFKYWSKGKCLDARTTPPKL